MKYQSTHFFNVLARVLKVIIKFNINIIFDLIVLHFLSQHHLHTTYIGRCKTFKIKQ